MLPIMYTNLSLNTWGDFYVSSCGEFERVELTYVMSDYSEVHTQNTGAESGWNRHTWHTLQYILCPAVQIAHKLVNTIMTIQAEVHT